MAKIISEERNVNDNVFQYEKKLLSPYLRFVDRTPTYVTYFHIDGNETTVDEGFKDTEELIGPNSSIRFQKIKDLPIYGISQMVMSLDEDDQGLDGSVEGEGIFLPHTIKPFQNDFFIINHLKDSYVFRVSGIEYDNIHPDNFYKINFILEAVGNDVIKLLENQVMQSYDCITENIGTDSQCIIQSEIYTKIKEVKAIYDDIANTYMSIFYSEKYNCILGEKPCSKKLYDPFLIEFANKWELFNDKERLNTYIFAQELQDRRFKLKYERSVWRFIERHDERLLNNFFYHIFPAVELSYTQFFLWYDESVYCLDIPLEGISEETCDMIFNNDFINAVKDDTNVDHVYAKLLKSYIRGEKLDVYSVSPNLIDALLSLNANLDFYFVTPMILFILKKIIKDQMSESKFVESGSMKL